MNKKRKTILLSTAFITSGLLLSIALVNLGNSPLMLFGDGGDPTCENYWTNDSYTSLHELAQMDSFDDEITT